MDCEGLMMEKVDLSDVVTSKFELAKKDEFLKTYQSKLFSFFNSSNDETTYSRIHKFSSTRRGPLFSSERKPPPNVECIKNLKQSKNINHDAWIFT